MMNYKYNFNIQSKEDNMGFLFRHGDTRFEVLGVADFNGDFYVRVIKNGFIDFNTRAVNENMIQCRISIMKPEYIYSDENLSEEEKQWFIEGITEMWDTIIKDADEYNKWYQTNYKLPDHIPDYSNL